MMNDSDSTTLDLRARLEREKRILQQAHAVSSADEDEDLIIARHKLSKMTHRTDLPFTSRYNTAPPPPPPAVCEKKGVGFDQEVRIYFVETHEEYTEEERFGSWHSPRELERSSKDVRKNVRYMRRQMRRASLVAAAAENAETNNRVPPTTQEQEDEEEPEGICTRGFEHLRSPAHTEQRRINRDCAVQAIFDEQELQRRSAASAGAGAPLVLDDERLRRASERGTEWARNHARRLGLQDERAAKKILDEDRRRAALVGVADMALELAPLQQREHLFLRSCPSDLDFDPLGNNRVVRRAPHPVTGSAAARSRPPAFGTAGGTAAASAAAHAPAGDFKSNAEMLRTAMELCMPMGPTAAVNSSDRQREEGALPFVPFERNASRTRFAAGGSHHSSAHAPSSLRSQLPFGNTGAAHHAHRRPNVMMNKGSHRKSFSSAMVSIHRGNRAAANVVAGGNGTTDQRAEELLARARWASERTVSSWP